MGPRVLAVHIRSYGIRVFTLPLCASLLHVQSSGHNLGNHLRMCFVLALPSGGKGGQKGTEAGTQGWVSGGCCLPISPRSLGSLQWGPTRDLPPPPVAVPRTRSSPRRPQAGAACRAGVGGSGTAGHGGAKEPRSKIGAQRPRQFWCERSNRGSDVCLMFRGRFDALIRESSASPIHHSSSSAIQTPL